MIFGLFFVAEERLLFCLFGWFAGEVAVVRAAYESKVPYMLPTLSSCSLDEMLEARAADQSMLFAYFLLLTFVLTEESDESDKSIELHRFVCAALRE
jgi:hypothetical protein